MNNKFSNKINHQSTFYGRYYLLLRMTTNDALMR